jgi:hypothetical protein
MIRRCRLHLYSLCFCALVAAVRRYGIVRWYFTMSASWSDGPRPQLICALENSLDWQSKAAQRENERAETISFPPETPTHS